MTSRSLTVALLCTVVSRQFCKGCSFSESSRLRLHGCEFFLAFLSLRFLRVWYLAQRLSNHSRSRRWMGWEGRDCLSVEDSGAVHSNNTSKGGPDVLLLCAWYQIFPIFDYGIKQGESPKMPDARLAAVPIFLRERSNKILQMAHAKILRFKEKCTFSKRNSQ